MWLPEEASTSTREFPKRSSREQLKFNKDIITSANIQQE
jgi:hypothetical protein